MASSEKTRREVMANEGVVYVYNPSPFLSNKEPSTEVRFGRREREQWRSRGQSIDGSNLAIKVAGNRHLPGNSFSLSHEKRNGLKEEEKESSKSDPRGIKGLSNKRVIASRPLIVLFRPSGRALRRRKVEVVDGTKIGRSGMTVLISDPWFSMKRAVKLF